MLDFSAGVPFKEAKKKKKKKKNVMRNLAIPSQFNQSDEPFTEQNH